MSCRVELTGAAAFEFGGDEIEFPAYLSGDRGVLLGTAVEIRDRISDGAVGNVLGYVIAVFCENVGQVIAHPI